MEHFDPISGRTTFVPPQLRAEIVRDDERRAPRRRTNVLREGQYRETDQPVVVVLPEA